MSKPVYVITHAYTGRTVIAFLTYTAARNWVHDPERVIDPSSYTINRVVLQYV